MLKQNALMINGKSTADLDFFVAVEEMPSINTTVKKDKIFELEHVNGALIQSVNAWSVVEEEFKFYLHDITRNELRQFKAFIGYQGEYSRYDDPTIHRKFISTEVTAQPLDRVGGYEAVVKFTCDPFEYEEEQTITLSNGQQLNNHATAPMYPKLEIINNGSVKTNAYIEIGDQRMTFERIENGTTIVECRHGYQDVYEKLGGKKINGLTKGPFFEIPPLKQSTVRFSSGITVRMLTRWGWV